MFRGWFRRSNSTSIRNRYSRLGHQGIALESRIALTASQFVPVDVTRPGDAIYGTSTNSPFFEDVLNAIDDQPSKYLNFDRFNTGFTVTPSIGATLVTGLSLTSANDAPGRDPATYRLEGSRDGEEFFQISAGSVPGFPGRLFKNYIFFENTQPYASYRLVFPAIVDSNANSMQISEVELLGVTAQLLKDITQPFDPIVGSSDNSPAFEEVASAIDDSDLSKYLNFDRVNTGFTVAPSKGLTLVQGITLTAARDAPERDPATFILSGDYDDNSFVTIASGTVPAFSARGMKHTILFSNPIPYTRYRLVFPAVVGPGGNSMQIAEVELLGTVAPGDVTQPGDPIVSPFGTSPPLEGVTNAISNTPSKYLNFDRFNAGLIVAPGVGATLVTGLTVTTANDAPERDPSSFNLEGSLDGQRFSFIANQAIPVTSARAFKHHFFFHNTHAYAAYRLVFGNVVGPNANSMQIDEIELLGDAVDLPQDVTQPGDPITATSINSPGSQGVENAIDNRVTIYTNFDVRNTGLTVTPSVGVSVVQGIRLTSSFNPPEHDPASFVLAGSHDGIHFAQIAAGSIPTFSSRLSFSVVMFENQIPYASYRLVFPTLVGVAPSNMQIAEVELIGTTKTHLIAPGDLNEDGSVDAADAELMFANWGFSGVGDVNDDGIVDAADAGMMFTWWTGDPLPPNTSKQTRW